MSPVALSTAKRRPERTARKPKRGTVEVDRHSRAAKDVEAVAVAESRDRSADATAEALAAQRDPYRLTGAELATEIDRALFTVPAARVLLAGVKRGERSPEWEALAAMVAERLYRRERDRSASGERFTAKRLRDWPKRAQLRPAQRAFAAPYGTASADRRARLYLAAAERDSGDRITRGAVGRDYIATIARGILIDSREWRDTVESFTTARDRQRDSGPMVVASEAVGVGALARAVAARSAKNGIPAAVVPAGGAELALALAERIGADRSGRERESIAVALLGALTDSPLTAIAAERGYSIATAKRHSTAGAKLIGGAYLSNEITAELVEAARELRPTGREHDGPDLTAIGRDCERSPVVALAAVDGARQVARQWAAIGALSGSITAHRAARRNLRADVASGRYGRSADRTAPEAVRVRAYPSAPLAPLPATVPDRPTSGQRERPAYTGIAARLAAVEAKRRDARCECRTCKDSRAYCGAVR